MSKFFLLLSLAIVLSSCQERQNTTLQPDDELIALQELLAAQTSQLMNRNLSKTVIAKNKTVSKELMMDSTLFLKDLEFLNSKKIIKVFGAGNYAKENEEKFSIYKRRNGVKNGPVQMKVSYDDNDLISEVEINEDTENTLFSSGFKFIMKFENQLLKEYTIRGVQKIIGLEPSEYVIIGKVSLD